MEKEGGKQDGNAYLAGLKKYKERGIPILIDGEKAPEEDWARVLEVREDHSFYMADFVASEETGELLEIRFDRVYNK